MKWGFTIKTKIKPIVKNHRILSWLYYENYVRLRIFIHRRGLQRKIKRQGTKTLRLIHTALTSAGVRYFADFGTLLGIVREGNFINHDLDIDIGVVVDTPKTKQLVQDALIGAGCRLKKEFSLNGVIVEQSFLYKSLKFDIGFYENSDTSSSCYLFYKNPNVLLEEGQVHVVKMTYHRIDSFEMRKFLGIEIIVPSNPERLLEEKYGDDWRIPNKDWIYWQAPSAQRLKDLGDVMIHL